MNVPPPQGKAVGSEFRSLFEAPLPNLCGDGGMGKGDKKQSGGFGAEAATAFS